MVRSLAVSCLVALAVMSFGKATLAAQTPAAPAAAPAAATPQSAAAFLGDWTLAAQGPNGATNFDLSIKADAGKLVAEIASDVQAKQAISTITKTDTGLVLRYGFDYQGMAIPAVVTLTPAADKVGVQIDFADGAYVLEGTATKKAAPAAARP
jgi:hypothetical protein